MHPDPVSLALGLAVAIGLAGLLMWAMLAWLARPERERPDPDARFLTRREALLAWRQVRQASQDAVTKRASMRLRITASRSEA